MFKNLIVVVVSCLVLLSGSSMGYANDSFKVMSAEYTNINFDQLISQMGKDYGFYFAINEPPYIGDKVVSISYTNKTYPEVLDSLARNYNFSWTLEEDKNGNNVALIGPKGTLFDTKHFQVNDLEKAKKLASTVVPPNKVVIEKTTSSIFVCASHEDMSMIEHLLRNI